MVCVEVAMTAKVFYEWDKFQIVGDSRDVPVDWKKREAVWDWCEANGITVAYQSTISQYGRDLWRVHNDKHRTLFILRWGNGSD
jgi:hypothetical protein